MSDKRKVIAVCLTRAYEDIRAQFISALCRHAAKRGWKLMFYNSFLDLNHKDIYSEGARSVFDAINYDLIDGLIIDSSSFYDGELLRQLTDACHSRRLPVVATDAVVPGCVSVIHDYHDAFKQLMTHVIQDHGVKDTFFIAGVKEEEHSIFRISCYQEVLQELGLPVNPENIAYGSYWEGPASAIVEELIATREKLPGAIFCANDTMAHGVINTLQIHGYRVPEDIIVTGFDGLSSSRVFRPHLSTCESDPDIEAAECLRLIDENISDGVIKLPHYPRFAASCGCKEMPLPEAEIIQTYQDMEYAYRHETILFQNAQAVMECQNIDELLNRLSLTMADDSILCLNTHFNYSDSNNEVSLTRALDHELICVPAANLGPAYDRMHFYLPDVFPGLQQWLANDHETACILTAVFSRNIVCGYYVSPLRNTQRDIQGIRRTTNILNFICTNMINQMQQKNMLFNLENSLYLDPMTGIPNLKGATRWYEEKLRDPEHVNKAFAVSVYAVIRYNYIMDNYGINDIEWLIRQIADTLTQANPSDALVARVADDQLIVVNIGDSGIEVGNQINEATATFFPLLEKINADSNKVYNIEVNCGSTVADNGWDNPLETYIKLAVGNLYLNRLKYGKGEALKETAQTKEVYQAFNTLMDHNLFKYHFQPIVDAKTGSIYAYEALMRTEVNLTPLEVLDIAREYNRLDEVEKVTFFGIMERYKQDYSLFRGSKVFINTIPGHFLGTTDVNRIFDLYEDYLDCFVFELTEQDSISDEELNNVKQLCKAGSQAHIAIDDYGTGHSNIANLLRYSPQVIKIDRFLIHDIRRDTNKQMFLKSTIEFAHANGIKTLAEGVESLDELQTVIEFGIDLIQGFYTARPTEYPITAIAEKVRSEIIAENVRLSKYDSTQLTYTAKDGETVSLLELALQKYTFVDVPNGAVTLKGERDHTVEIVVRQPDNTQSVITFENVNIKGSTQTTVQLGSHCSTVIQLKGANTLNKEGIRVPPTSSLTLQGYGSLTINNNRNYGVGIGGNFNEPYGNITIEMAGKLTLKASGDKVIGIGGGSSEGNVIQLVRGNCRISAKGINLVAVGSSSGPADIRISEGFTLQTDVEGNDALSLGTLDGDASIVSSGALTLITDGERTTGLGTMLGKANVQFNGGSLLSIVHCDLGACVGTLNGIARVQIREANINVRGEGNKVAGLGSVYGTVNAVISSGKIRGEVLASDHMLLGNDDSVFVVAGGNILFDKEDLRRKIPVSPTGRELNRVEPDTDRFEQEITDGDVTYVYVADRDPDTGELAVWI